MSGKLRFITRDGKQVLQQRVETGAMLTSNPPQIQYKWEDVPVIDAPAEDAKPKMLKVWWLSFVGFDRCYTAWPTREKALEYAPTSDPIQVVECPKGHRVVSEAQIESLWRSQPPYDVTSKGMNLKDFKAALGFGGSDE